jgi:hypothetical protein
MFVRQNVRSAKRPFGKMSVRQNVRSAKCPSAKCPFGKMSFGKVSFGKMSGYQTGIVPDKMKIACINTNFLIK